MMSGSGNDGSPRSAAADDERREPPGLRDRRADHDERGADGGHGQVRSASHPRGPTEIAEAQHREAAEEAVDRDLGVTDDLEPDGEETTRDDDDAGRAMQCPVTRIVDEVHAHTDQARELLRLGPEILDQPSPGHVPASRATTGANASNRSSPTTT